MREILYRGKNELTNEWEYGSLHIQSGEVNENDNQELEYRILGLRGEIDYVIPETVGQYIGLTDKNGKKIFEGDILEVDVYEYETESYSFSVFDEIVGRRNKKQTGRKIKALWTVEYKEHRCRGNGFFAYGKDRRFNILLTQSTLFNANPMVIGNIHDNPELLGGEEE